MNALLKATEHRKNRRMVLLAISSVLIRDARWRRQMHCLGRIPRTDRYRLRIRRELSCLLTVILVVPLLLIGMSACTRHTVSTTTSPEDTRPPVELRAEVDKAELSPDDTVTFTVVLETDPDLDVSLPEIGSRIEGLRIVEVADEGPRLVDGRKRLEKIFRLKADLEGSYILPSLTIPYKDAEGKEHTATTGQIFIKVTHPVSEISKAQEQGLRDIKPLETIRRPRPKALIAVLLCSVAAVALFVLGLLWHRRRKRDMQRVLSPEECAQAELQDLLASGLLEEGRLRAFVFHLSLLFRRYLERKYAIRAVEHTTEEILRDLRTSELIEEEKKGLTRAFLMEIDPVKYRGVEPSLEEVQGWVSRLESFIQVPASPIHGEAMEEAA